MAVNILACNVGSTSLRMTALCMQEASGEYEVLQDFHGAYEDLEGALTAMSPCSPFEGIAHRVVHGGVYSLERALVIDSSVESAIEGARALAPDHNGAMLHVLHRCREKFGNQNRQVAVFDSHFHATLPERAFRYALPSRIIDDFDIRRYGFHGLSHAYSAAQISSMAPGAARHISIHAGGGTSIAAIAEGRCIDTTMGFTPLEGPLMSTRSGSIDPGIIFELYRRGLSIVQIEQIVMHESGLLALSGISGDYRRLARESLAGHELCTSALDVYHRRIAGETARMIASLNGVDVVSFTGGVGENVAAFRSAVCSHLTYLRIGTSVPVFAIAAREDVLLARAAAWALREPHRLESVPG